MFCAHCGVAAQAGSRFCGHCGAPLLAPDVTSNRRPTTPMGAEADVAFTDQPTPATSAPTHKQQLQALKLELKRLKLELREVNAQGALIGSQPPQPQYKQALEQRISRLEEHILALESVAGNFNCLPKASQ